MSSFALARLYASSSPCATAAYNCLIHKDNFLSAPAPDLSVNLPRKAKAPPASIMERILATYRIHAPMGESRARAEALATEEDDPFEALRRIRWIVADSGRDISVEAV